MGTFLLSETPALLALHPARGYPTGVYVGTPAGCLGNSKESFPSANKLKRAYETNLSFLPTTEIKSGRE
jgi:hypothetical protein